MNWLLGIAFGAGALLSVQAAVNARLGKEMGNPAIATLVSFVVGMAGIVLYLLLTRSALPPLSQMSRAPIWAWVGGLLGAIYVGVTIVLTPRIGVAAMSGLAVAGQMTMSLILDQFGLFGLAKHPISTGRVFGAVLLIAGAAMIKLL